MSPPLLAGACRTQLLRLNILICGGSVSILVRRRFSGATPMHWLVADRLAFLGFAKHRFDVDDRCAIDGFHGTDSQTLLAYFAYGDLMN
jgi:hypothetical protein